jgi:hypothetical protein
MDSRNITLKIRALVDSVRGDDARLYFLLGAFQNFLDKLATRLGVSYDRATLNKKISKFIKKKKRRSGKKKTAVDQSALKEPLSWVGILRFTIENPSTDLIEIVYLFGFSMGLLNRIMRKLHIKYQLPSIL